MDLYTKTTATKILADMPAARIEIHDPTNPNRIIGYIWETCDPIFPWNLYTPYHPATVSVRHTAYEATKYVTDVATLFGHPTHLDNPALLV